MKHFPVQLFTKASDLMLNTLYLINGTPRAIYHAKVMPKYRTPKVMNIILHYGLNNFFIIIHLKLDGRELV